MQAVGKVAVAKDESQGFKNTGDLAFTIYSHMAPFGVGIRL
jgi:hypothetical protein